MFRKYAQDSDVRNEFKNHVVLGQWEIVEAFAKFLFGESDKQFVDDMLRSVALHPHLSSCSLLQNVQSPEQLSFLAARYLEDETLVNDAAFRVMLRNIPDISEECRYQLLKCYTHGEPLEMEVINVLKQVCLRPVLNISLYIVLQTLKLPQVTLECALQVCMQMFKANNARSLDQLMEKLEELISFTPDSGDVPLQLLESLSHRLIDIVMVKGESRLYSSVMGCRHLTFQKFFLNEISSKQCVLSRALNKEAHYLEIHLNDVLASITNDEGTQIHDLHGINLRPLAFTFAWTSLLKSDKFLIKLEELAKTDGSHPMIKRLTSIVKECRLISNVTKIELMDLVTQRQCQSLLRVLHSTGGLKSLSDEQILHIVEEPYQSNMIKGFLAMKHACSALRFAILISERKFESNIFQPRNPDEEISFSSVFAVIRYIEAHGPDVAFEALVIPELRNMEEMLRDMGNDDLKAEVLENIFSLLFVRHVHLQDVEESADSDDEGDDDSTRYDLIGAKHGIRSSGFLTPKRFISQLLPALVSQIRSTKLELSEEKKLLARLEKLHSYVRDALWRLELVEEKMPLSAKLVAPIDDRDEMTSSLTKSTSQLTPKTQRRRSQRQRTKSHTAQMNNRSSDQCSVVELMLSKLDALLRHCLWKSDYKRADQVMKVQRLQGNSDAKDTAELQFCLQLPEIEEQLLRLQKSSDSVSAIFAAIETFLQTQPLTQNLQNLAAYYLDLAFTSDLRLSVIQHLVTYSAERSKDSKSLQNGLQAINTTSKLIESITTKMADTDLKLQDTFQVNTCHLDGERIRGELQFWEALSGVMQRISDMLQDVEVNVTNGDLHQEFLKLAKLSGVSIRKFHTRLVQFNFDFLRALYAHARQVYKALEENRQHNVQLRPGLKGYFLVLEECSPSMTLLKLILHENANPQRHEEFASKMKLNITQCVSKKILPNIYMRQVMYNDSCTLKVLNADTQANPAKNVVARNAAFVAQKLISQLIDILREKSNDKLVMERYENLREVAFSAPYDRWRESTRELSSVDLSRLKTEEKLPFFLNVYHCLMLDKLLYKSKKGHPFSLSNLEIQIDDHLFAYHIGALGVVTLLQLKYAILFDGHSVKPLRPPLSYEVTLPPEHQQYLPAANCCTIFSLVQCVNGDPPLRVIENEDQVVDGFAKAILKIIMERQKMYVPWQMRELLEGTYFSRDERAQELRVTLIKMISGFQTELVYPHKFWLNLNIASSSDVCEPGLDRPLNLPNNVVKYIEQHCPPIGLMLQSNIEGNTSALERMLKMLPNAKVVALSGNITEEIWKMLEEIGEKENALIKMLECIQLCDAITGGRILTSKLHYLRQLIFKSLSKQSFRFALLLESNSDKVQAFLDCYKMWPDGDIELAGKALKSSIPSDSKDFEHLCVEIGRINLYQAIGRFLHRDWRTVTTGIPKIIDELKAQSKFDLIFRISKLELLDKNDEKLMSIVNECTACHHFSLSKEEDYVAGLKIVDSYPDAEHTLDFCQRILNLLNPSRGKLYLIRYMASKYESDPKVLARLEKQALALEALLVLPPALRSEYQHLDEYPEVIVEQLLMNGQLELITKILRNSEFINEDFLSKVDILCEIFAKRALELSNMSASSYKRDSLISNNNVARTSVTSFIMPVKAPSVKDWVRDDAVDKCMICAGRFTLLVRKHHCRRCGRIVCKDCSAKGRLIVEGHGNVPVRVCDDCFMQTTEPEVMEATEAIEAFTPNSLSKKVATKVETTWHLKEPFNNENREFNENTRRIFFYERAPSVSLCLSILERHSNSERAAHFILSLCDRLVALLVFPSEIDYGLVIAMLQTLLMKARLNLIQAHSQGSLEWCESYLQTLDLLRILVNENCQDLIPRELLSQHHANANDFRNVHRKLRDRLIGAERFSLALELSSKCGLDKHTVMAAWGLSMLRAGDWAAAREKLSFCLRRTPSQDMSKSDSPLVRDILTILQSSNYVGVTKAAAVFCSIANLKTIKSNGLRDNSPSSTDKDVSIASECWFYLENFASPSTVLSYLMKRGELTKSLLFCISKNVDNETVVEQVFMRQVKENKLEHLFKELKSLGDAADRFNTHILTWCNYLVKNGYMNTLHNVQIFMEDWVRAAMTCINFFEKESAPLTQSQIVSEKLYHLMDAKKYLQRYIERSVSGTKAKSVHLSMPLKEVNKHLTTVSLQIDVSKYFARREATNGQIIRIDTDATASIPTLFAKQVAAREALAALILMNGSNIEEGFGLCLRVIQDGQLEGMEVFKKVVYNYAVNPEMNLGAIEKLAKCIQTSGFDASKFNMDTVIIGVQGLLLKKPGRDEDDTKKKIDQLQKLIVEDRNKIIAYIESDRLRSAYMLAVRQKDIELVKRIKQKATLPQFSEVYTLCDKWLSKTLGH